MDQLWSVRALLCALCSSMTFGQVSKIIVFTGLLAALLLVSAGFGAMHLAAARGPLASDSVVLVEAGSTARSVTKKLHHIGAISGNRLFPLYMRLTNSPVRMGEYRLSAGSSLVEIADVLSSGRSIQRYVTLPEGVRLSDVSGILARAEHLGASDDPLTLREGDILPETYAYVYGDTADDILMRAAAAMTDLLLELWASRQAGLPLNTPEEALTLASIVEKETGLAHERGLVASVFINRLRKGMRLQSDPTVIYGRGVRGGGITRADLADINPYNTYRIAGLPPTPIASPGRASLEAVLNPPVSDYLYFVADGSGGHAFAKTLAEHNRNVRTWRTIEAQRKAMP